MHAFGELQGRTGHGDSALLSGPMGMVRTSVLASGARGRTPRVRTSDAKSVRCTNCPGARLSKLGASYNTRLGWMSEPSCADSKIRSTFRSTFKGISGILPCSSYDGAREAKPAADRIFLTTRV